MGSCLDVVALVSFYTCADCKSNFVDFIVGCAHSSVFPSIFHEYYKKACREPKICECEVSSGCIFQQTEKEDAAEKDIPFFQMSGVRTEGACTKGARQNHDYLSQMPDGIYKEVLMA